MRFRKFGVFSGWRMALPLKNKRPGGGRPRPPSEGRKESAIFPPEPHHLILRLTVHVIQLENLSFFANRNSQRAQRNSPGGAFLIGDFSVSGTLARVAATAPYLSIWHLPAMPSPYLIIS